MAKNFTISLPGVVKRWNGPRMIMRWTAAALLAVEKKFRRIKGCEQLTLLEKVLHEQQSTSHQKCRFGNPGNHIFPPQL